MYRESGEEGFLLLPDLNWDRKTMGSLHLLGLVERRDIWSVRDLEQSMAEWVKHMREKMIEATVKLYPEIEKDELKLYVHCKFVR
jgi:m7GpppX diphosphatase